MWGRRWRSSGSSRRPTKAGPRGKRWSWILRGVRGDKRENGRCGGPPGPGRGAEAVEPGENAFGGELFEILSHGGIPHRRVFDPKELGKPDVLLVALAGREAVPLLKDVAERGGEVFVFGSFPEMAGALGAEEKMIEGAGYAYTEEENRPPLRFLRACR